MKISDECSQAEVNEEVVVIVAATEQAEEANIWSGLLGDPVEC